MSAALRGFPRVGTVLWILLLLPLVCTQALAAEIWTTPVEAPPAEPDKWALNNGSAASFDFHVPDNMVEFLSAKIVVIPAASGELTYEVSLSMAQSGQRFDTYTDELSGLASSLTEAEILEIDVSDIFPTNMFAGQDFVSLEFRYRGLKHVRVLGLRFAFEGEPGPPGPPGADGQDGAPGPTGEPGAEGPAGLQGDPGPQGSTGPAGLQGQPGPQGDVGAQGPTGPEGDPGLPGAQGLAGLQGEPGPQGDAGPAGLQGDPGPQGSTGAAGLQGETGPQGDAGPAGLQGEPGPQGDAGPAGLQGEPGPQGDAGPAGLQGEPGPQGDVGAEGPAGPQGDPGLPGDAGAQGPAGDAGPQGMPGPQGPAGLQGVPGPSGPTGPEGPQGPSDPDAIAMKDKICEISWNLDLAIPGYCPAPASCMLIHVSDPALPSGVYTVDTDGIGGADPFDAYCDMDTDGGGWTLWDSSAVDGLPSNVAMPRCGASLQNNCYAGTYAGRGNRSGVFFVTSGAAAQRLDPDLSWTSIGGSIESRAGCAQVTYCQAGNNQCLFTLQEDTLGCCTNPSQTNWCAN